MKTIIDNHYIDMINYVMVLVLESKWRIFDNQYVIEDGAITGVIKKNKIIKRYTNSD